MKTGVAGCGRMGLPMALALRHAGIETVGFDIRRRNDFETLPMEFSPEVFSRDLTVLFTVVRDETQTEDLLFARQAVLEHALALEYLVVCSTLAPTYICEIRKRVPSHINIVDAPMSGASVAAREARLSFMLGGEQQIIDELMLHFAAMGRSFHHMGALGSGMTAKVLNNLVAAAATAATRTALDWADHQGLSRAELLKVMTKSSGQTWFSSNFEDIEFSRDGYAEDNSIGILAKDVEAAFSAAPDGASPHLTDALIQTIRALEPLED